VLVDNKLKTKYIIRCWIPAYDDDNAPIFDSWNEAIEEKTHLMLLQPENIYELEEVSE
jgi:hypothetical protein